MLSSEIPTLPGSHFAVVDSGTPVHIVYDHLFVTNIREDYTPVSGFSGNYSRATHRGDLSFRALSYNYESNTSQYTSLLEPNTTLVVPDCVRRLYSVRQATHAGYRVHLESTKPGLMVCLQYIPFVTDPDTNLWLLPMFPPSSRDNGIYPLPSPAKFNQSRPTIGTGTYSAVTNDNAETMTDHDDLQQRQERARKLRSPLWVARL